jgi:hypothetical protein
MDLYPAFSVIASIKDSLLLIQNEIAHLGAQKS